MKLLLAFVLSFAGTTASAQDSWKVCLDHEILLNTSIEDAGKNLIRLSPEPGKKKNLVVSYKEVSPQYGWQRTIAVFDSMDNGLKKQEGHTFVLSTPDLYSLLHNYRTIKIYTINSPTDPKMKAQVRLRRVHLCTLILQE